MKSIASSLFLIALLIGCSEQHEDSEYVAISPGEAYTAILGNLDPDRPGRGKDVFNHRKQDRPMAYGLILSAESNRFKATKDSSAIQMARNCGRWILNNSDLNSNGIYGFGLADAWDAFGDSSVNPANTEYTITTALAVEGLLDWYQIESDSLLLDSIVQVLDGCLKPYLNEQFNSPLQIPAYSLSIPDRHYDVYNPAAYLSGVLMRYSKLIEDDSISSLAEAKADVIMEELLRNQNKDENGNSYWNYGIQIKRPNDLVHACYIIEGIRSYKEAGRSVAISYEAAMGHLMSFYNHNKWFEYVEEDSQTNNINSRLWGLGMLMFSLSQNGNDQSIEATLWPQIMRYHKGDGYFRFKENDDRSLVRQDAHLLLGLSCHLFD